VSPYRLDFAAGYKEARSAKGFCRKETALNSRKLFVLFMVMLMTFGAYDVLAGCEETGCKGYIPATIGSEVAHSSMGGSTLNNTTAIFNAFPHLVVYNGNGVEIDTERLDWYYKDIEASPFARAWYEYKEDLWLILDVGRDDYGARAANFMWGQGRTMPNFMPQWYGLDDFDYEGLTHPWVNIGFAKPTSTGGAWSANVFFGADTSEDGEGDYPTTDGSTGIGALFSWGNGTDLNLSAEVVTKTDTDEYYDGEDLVEDKGNLFGVSLNARKDTATRIYQGSVVFGSGSIEPYDDDKEDVSMFGVYASCGRFLKNEKDGQTSVEFFASFETEKYSGTEGESDWEDKDTWIALPGVRIAAWEQISKHFGIMGAVYGMYWIDKDQDSYGDDTTDDDTDKYHWYDWTAGMFYQPKANVRVDLQFNKSNLGQIISLGNSSPLAMYLGATIGL
jgi:hypothetical protein